MTKNKSSLRNQKSAVAQVLFADVIWGLGFTMAQWALFLWTPIVSSAVRLILAFLLCVVFFAFKRELKWSEAKRALVPGLLNGGVLIFQTWGLQYTDVTKVGFITTLYVVFVPVLERFFFQRKLHALHWFFVFMALLGTLIISGAHFEDINRGDFLTLICSLFAGLHIVSLSNLKTDISPVRFNMWQSGWSALLALASVAIFERHGHWIPQVDTSDPRFLKALIGLFALVVGSSIVAFSIQAHAQRFIAASTAGLLYLLECIFGALFAFLLNGERMSAFQWSGAILILLSAIAVIRLETRVLDVKT